MELSGLSLEASFRLLVRELGVRVGVCLLAVGLRLLERLLAEKQIFHNKIVGNPVVVGAVSTMKKIDPCTLWWVVQWGNECLARFKASATVEEVGALESYKTWTQKEKAKRLAGFIHSTKSESQPSSAQKATPAKDCPFFDSD